ncbi:MAG TPA: potassium-transporting ATPase subunit KdpC [Propionicimonas sp.]|jgi:K+-transporting ATPase ATPase C chain
MSSSSTRGGGRLIWVALRAMVMFTAVVGVAYTLVVTGIGQLVLPAQARGSLVTGAGGQVAGSALVGQSFTGADGNPLPQYFQSRPSAAGKGYGATSSSGSNWGPENPDLVKAIADRKAQVAAFDGVPQDAVPADAVTASGSGLDPDISPAYAAIQVSRVAAARHLPPAEVRNLVAGHTQDRALGFLGEPTVNVVELNLALDDLQRSPGV